MGSWKGAFVGILASLSGILLWVILIFFNPYVGGLPGAATILLTFIGLGLPAIIGFLSSMFKIKYLMYISFISSLPASLYLAGTPSIFRFFIVISLGYLVSAILLTINSPHIKS